MLQMPVADGPSSSNWANDIDTRPNLSKSQAKDKTTSKRLETHLPLRQKLRPARRAAEMQEPWKAYVSHSI